METLVPQKRAHGFRKRSLVVSILVLNIDLFSIRDLKIMKQTLLQKVVILHGKMTEVITIFFEGCTSTYM